MTNTKQTAFRLPETLIQRIDHYGGKLRAKHPTFTFSRTDVVRYLLERGLDAEYLERTKVRKAGKR